MPVSVTSKATTAGAFLRETLSVLQPLLTGETVSLTPPSPVNLKALDKGSEHLLQQPADERVLDTAINMAR